MGLSVFRIRIQDKQSETSWKVRLELYQDETLREKQGIFQFRREDFSKLQNLSVKDYGIYLGKALFQNELREFFISAFHNSEQSMKVALSIELDDSPESQQLKALHWERLCAPIQNTWEFLAFNQRLPFTHHVSTGNLRKYSLIQKENLRALILIANPEDLEAEYNLAPIDVEATVERIQDAFGEIKCDILANHTKNVIGLPTIKQLREKLSTANPPYTILHIVSHGRVLENGQTIVYWSNEANQVEPIQGKYLIEQLGRCDNLPHLIFLCCCSSASFFGGLAQSLIRDLATPIVIAMTDTVTIKTAVELSRNFYPRLQESGEVDVVLQRASIPLADRYDITVPALFSYRINSSLYGIQVNIVGGKDYALQIFAAAPNSVNGRINWEEYRSESKVTEPYKFLSYYNTIDADIFFGRDAVSELLVAKISGNKLVLINGKSGSGKTSLINAGIIPRLVEQGYFTMVFRDYGYPTETIKAALAKLENVNIDLSDCKTLLDCIQATIQQTGRPIVIFLDQFERFFLNLPQEQWKQFARELKDCLNQLDSQQMNIVMALRVDFYGQLGEFWEDIPEINTESYQHYLKPLNPTEAKDAIEKPLERMPEKVGYDSDFLANVLVPNLLQRSEGQSQDQIEPVHLQIVCNQLFEEVRKRYSEPLKAGKIVTIKQDLYDDLGGVEGILQEYVEVILHRQFNTREQQDEVKTVLKQMVNSRGTREFKSVEEIAENLSLKQERVEKIFEQLDQSRLIETLSGEDSRKKYSITHEYLAKQINQWYTFNELELKRATELYERCLENWKLNNSNRIPRSQLEYLRKYRPNLLKWKPEGKQLFQESEWLYHGLNAAVVLSLATLVGLTITALIGQRNAAIGEMRASRQASEAFFNTGSEQLEALAEVVKSAKILQSNWLLKLLKPAPHLQTQVRGTLWKSFYQTQEQNRLQHSNTVKSASFSPDGNSIVTADDNGTAKLWNLQGEELATIYHDGPIYSASFSPDSNSIVTAADDATAKLWNLQGEELATFNHPGQVGGLSFSFDGKAYLSANNTGKKRTMKVYSADFSPDGKSIVTASDRTAKLWNLQGEELATLNHTEQIYSANFSPDGKSIVTASDDRTAKLWNLKGEELATLNHTRQVNSASFSPDGKSIVTASYDTTAKLWNLKGEELATLNHTDRVNSASFSSDGNSIVTTSKDGTVKLWNLKGEELAILYDSESVISADFSPDGKSILTVSDDRNAKLWNLQWEGFATLYHPDEVISADFSPDGNLIVTASLDNTAKLWNLQGEALATLQHTADVISADFSPDGNLIVTASLDNTAKLWNLQGEALATLQHSDRVNSADFS
ncbi:MAG: CHAT domain-containing protein, partial [Limnoraphis sp.]